MVVSVMIRLFPAIRNESLVFDYDPYFNRRTTEILDSKGFYEFWNWFDDSKFAHVMVVQWLYPMYICIHKKNPLV